MPSESCASLAVLPRFVGILYLSIIWRPHVIGNLCFGVTDTHKHRLLFEAATSCQREQCDDEN